MARRTPTVLSAFSGLGGLDLGIEAAGFQHVGCIERDEFARRSLKANRGDTWHLIEPGDLSVLIDSLTPETLDLAPRQLSLLAGGPPCQPFSKAAQWSASARVGLEDVRSHCLRDYLTLVERFLPKVVLIENVSGFIQGGVSALPEIESRLVESTSPTEPSIDRNIESWTRPTTEWLNTGNEQSS